MQFQVTMATKRRMLTRCMNVSYIVDQERASSLMSQRIVSIHRVLIIFCVDKRSLVYCTQEAVYGSLFVCVISGGLRYTSILDASFGTI
jgi:hypothetical protein